MFNNTVRQAVFHIVPSCSYCLKHRGNVIEDGIGVGVYKRLPAKNCFQVQVKHESKIPCAENYNECWFSVVFCRVCNLQFIELNSQFNSPKFLMNWIWIWGTHPKWIELRIYMSAHFERKSIQTKFLKKDTENIFGAYFFAVRENRPIHFKVNCRPPDFQIPLCVHEPFIRKLPLVL